MTCKSQIDYSATDHLFANLRLLSELLSMENLNSYRDEMKRRVDAALSWEPVVIEKPVVTEKGPEQ
jgi:hypothetical protein